jgi:hypothetical protein
MFYKIVLSKMNVGYESNISAINLFGRIKELVDRFLHVVESSAKASGLVGAKTFAKMTVVRVTGASMTIGITLF